MSQQVQAPCRVTSFVWPGHGISLVSSESGAHRGVLSGSLVMARMLALVLTFGIAAGHPAPVSGQTQAQGRVTRENSIIWRVDTSTVPLATVRQGTVLTIVAQSGRWYEVLVPGRPGVRGLIARAQVELVPGTPAPPVRPDVSQPAPTPPRPQPRAGSAAAPAPASGASTRFPRGFVAADGAYQAGVFDFEQTVTSVENAEEGRSTTHYSVERAAGFSVSAGALMSPAFGAGATVSRFSQSAVAELTAEIPHPLAFGAPRTVESLVDNLEREELAVHGHVFWRREVGPRADVVVFGGPSLVRLTQDVVAGLDYSEVFPYDTARFESARIVTSRKWGLGVNAGAGAAFFFSRTAGVGVTGMFSRATVNLPVNESHTAAVKTGGLAVSGGLRLRF